MKHKEKLIALFSVLTIVASQPAYAQVSPEAPQETQNAPVMGDELRGRVVYFKDFSLQVRTRDGYKNVALHPGTVLNPRGLKLHDGQFVRVIGTAGDNGVIDASQIDFIPRPHAWREHGGERIPPMQPPA